MASNTISKFTDDVAICEVAPILHLQTTTGNDPDQIEGTDAILITAVANAAAADVVTITNASFGQASTITIPDPGAAAASFVLSAGPVVMAVGSTITYRVTAGQAALASAGKVVVQAHTSATSQFAVCDIKVTKATGLSGNSGNRLLTLGDGTLVFNNAGITAALLGTPIPTIWGGTGNPLPASTVDFTASTAGADIYLQYAGGSADYNAGSVVILITLAMIAA